MGSGCEGSAKQLSGSSAPHNPNVTAESAPPPKSECPEVLVGPPYATASCGSLLKLYVPFATHGAVVHVAVVRVVGIVKVVVVTLSETFELMIVKR